MHVEGFRALYRFPGYVVKQAQVEPFLVQITLRRDGRCTPRCPECGHRMSPNRELWQSARDLSVGPVAVALIRYPALQGRCRHCSRYATIRPGGIDERQRATWRMMAYTSGLCRFMPVRRVAEVLQTSESVVRRWDKRVLRETLAEPDLDHLSVLPACASTQTG